MPKPDPLKDIHLNTSPSPRSLNTANSGSSLAFLQAGEVEENVSPPALPENLEASAANTQSSAQGQTHRPGTPPPPPPDQLLSLSPRPIIFLKRSMTAPPNLQSSPLTAPSAPEQSFLPRHD